jgi:hypothetical protein
MAANAEGFSMKTYFCKAYIKDVNGNNIIESMWLQAIDNADALSKIEHLCPDYDKYEVTPSSDDIFQQYNKSGNWTGD